MGHANGQFNLPTGLASAMTMPGLNRLPGGMMTPGGLTPDLMADIPACLLPQPAMPLFPMLPMPQLLAMPTMLPLATGLQGGGTAPLPLPVASSTLELPGFQVHAGFSAGGVNAMLAAVGLDMGGAIPPGPIFKNLEAGFGGACGSTSGVANALRPQQEPTLQLLSGYLHQKQAGDVIELQQSLPLLVKKQQEQVAKFYADQERLQRQMIAEEERRQENEIFQAERLRRSVEQNEGYFQPVQPIGYVMYNNSLKYTIIHKNYLGVGVFSVVWPCADSNNKLVALKVIRYQEHFRRYADKEVLIMQRVTELAAQDPEGSAQIATMRDFFVHKVGQVEHLCMAFEKLEDNLRTVGRLPLDKVLRFSKQILVGLRYLHDIVGLVHCDVKPDNLLLRWDGLSVKLCDFGTCRSSPELQPIDELQPLFYRAPEVLLGVVRGRKIDMWSAGCTLFELATGRILFRLCNTHREVVEKIQKLRGPIPREWREKGRLANAYFSSRGFHPEAGQPVDPDATYKKVAMHLEMLPSVDFGKENARAASDLGMAQLAKLLGGNTVLQAAQKKQKGGSQNESEKKVKLLAALIERMLEIEPSQRITAAEAVQHEALQGVELPPAADLQEAPPLPAEAPPPLPPMAPPPRG